MRIMMHQCHVKDESVSMFSVSFESMNRPSVISILMVIDLLFIKLRSFEKFFLN